MGRKWTDEQLAVIESKNCSMLVSAAAGSGKTAVLVERIIHLLTDEKHPVDIEKLLVVTFTNAAAAEMRERIGKGIDDRLATEPDNEQWQRQKLMLGYAQISTIHSLCMKLLREHFDVLDIDPSFRIGDDAEIKLLKADVAADLMEVCYESKNTAFREFVERYASGRTDGGIAELIIEIYDFIQGMPWPAFWLKKCCDSYMDWASGKSKHPVFELAIKRTHRVCKQYEKNLRKLYNLAQNTEKADKYLNILASDLEIISELLKLSDYDKLYVYLSDIKYKSLPGGRVAENLKELKEDVKLLHGEIKEAISDVYDSCFVGTTKDVMAQMEYLYPSVKILAELVDMFSERYTTEKRDRNMLDFSDLEHETLKLLADFSENENGEIIIKPTPVADALSAYYSEVICDEYQDSNRVQEMILDILSGERNENYNRFMVGDVKQSIYKFRLADAGIFMDKYHEFNAYKEGGNRIRIDLHKNFRSRATVLESINYIFEQIMRKELGGIDYDDTAALKPGLTFPDAGNLNVGGATELVLIDTSRDTEDEDTGYDDADLTSIELEAHAVAKRIREITDKETGSYVFDADRGEYRLAEYKDIVILLRTVSGWTQTFVEILGQNNIPVIAELSTGFFDTPEIRTMISMLNIIDNPWQDIPVAAVLKSPIIGMSSDELALIRAYKKDVPFYRACLEYGEDLPGYEKLRRFIKLLNKLREASLYMELHELIRYMYDITGYYDYVQVIAGGKRRAANLELLIERAIAYETGSYSGLFNFVRYLEQLKKNNIDFGEASVLENTGGNVRIVSIHKSKGLEYPIVILAGLGKKFNFRDTYGKVVLDTEYGMGLDAVNLITRRKMVSVNKRFIANKMIRDTLAEELRILYVAMTRAKEKLIMVGCFGSQKPDEQLQKWYRGVEASIGFIPEYILEKANSYMDFIMPCIMRTGAVSDIMSRFGLPFTCHDGEGTDLFKVVMTNVYGIAVNQFEQNMTVAVNKECLTELTNAVKAGSIWDELSKDAAWQYNWKEILGISGKYTVSQLKRMHADSETSESENIFDDAPVFMNGENGADAVNGAFRGTAYHKVLELLDFAGIPSDSRINWISKQLKEMLSKGRITKEQHDKIYLKDIEKLVSSRLGQGMKEADCKGLLYREKQFVMGVPVGTVHKDIQLDEIVVVQGVIDAYYEEDGKLILIDYKTDRVPEIGGEELLWNRYHSQLEYYQYALERMTKKPVASKLIYSFCLGKVIEI